METNEIKPALPENQSRLFKTLAIIATATALILVAVLATRPVSSFDIGYHLAYGEYFLDNFKIVQTNRFIYTHLRSDLLSNPDNLGPGCWYDSKTGTYHFVNANWLSQVIMAAVYRLGGIKALSIFQTIMIVFIFLVILLTMRRNGVGWLGIAFAIVLTALAGYERFNLRPEVFEYLILIIQWYLLVGILDSPQDKVRLSWRKVVLIFFLQILAVNLHSYFLLGIAMVAAILADVLVRLLWAKTVSHRDTSNLEKLAKTLTLTTLAMILACLINPWFIRGAIMPFQTLNYLNKHHIAGGTIPPFGSHPWAMITEFFSPFAEYQIISSSGSHVIKAYCVVLVLSGIAIVISLILRRWGWSAVLIGMVIISLRMRRNISIASMIAVPLSAIILTEGWRRIMAWGKSKSAPVRKVKKRRKKTVFQNLLLFISSLQGKNLGLIKTVLPLFLITFTVWTTHLVITNRFYFSEERKWRFGVGISKLTTPISAAEWINKHQPPGKVFCDHDSSSNLMFFTRPHREVPDLTNTWAMPPYVMQWVLECTYGLYPFEKVIKEYNIGTVSLYLTRVCLPLIRKLSRDPDWVVVHLGAAHVVFLKRTGPTAKLAARFGITEQTFNLDRYINYLRTADPLPCSAFSTAASLLTELGWYDSSLILWNKCLEYEPTYYQASSRMARTYALRANHKLREMIRADRKGDAIKARRLEQDAIEDFNRAKSILEEVLRTHPDYIPAQKGLSIVRKHLSALRQGVVMLLPNN